MKKCFILVDFFKESFKSIRRDFSQYAEDRYNNLLEVLTILKFNKHYDLVHHGDVTRFYGPLIKFVEEKFDETKKYEKFYIAGLSTTQCVTELYNKINSDEKYIVKNCCLQEYHLSHEKVKNNFDHPLINNQNQLKRFEESFLNGKIRFNFYDNSPNNDGKGEWVKGDFKKSKTILSEELL
jgi:hypothetical protein